MTTCTSYGAELRARRVAAQLTQRELAELAGVPRPKVTAYEVGRRVPNDDTMERLDRALRTPRLSRVRAVGAALIEAATWRVA
ncbi:helix-turn-helix domain-containing protein [Agromyces bauzanensis]|uniref:HTH cro/C1-type domain-containing protein n=1 Tax=Agromyces bauzanensis TaxID=1308924 RepID=A0A917PWG0_9MICO|nr:helix-turn-helix transcriptional regulator [Agromyces bauzanensis]GGJ95249.1 hypothetical protein GCM10011372_36790 [Agromyces bauzanensis]